MIKIELSEGDLAEIITKAVEDATKDMASEITKLSSTVENSLVKKRRVIENGQVVIKSSL